MQGSFIQSTVIAVCVALVAGFLSWTTAVRQTDRALAGLRDQIRADLDRVVTDNAQRVGSIEGRLASTLAEDEQIQGVLNRFSERISIVINATLNQEGRLGRIEGVLGVKGDMHTLPPAAGSTGPPALDTPREP